MKRNKTDASPGVVMDNRSDSDVVVSASDQTVLFAPQNARASEWLHHRCRMTDENSTGHTQFLVHPALRRQLVAELKAVGFQVAENPKNDAA